MTDSDKATQSVSIPPYLLAQVQAGQTVLVLGAGASIGATHPAAKTPPTGKILACLLADEFLGGHHANDSLSSVADMAIAASDVRAVQRFIAARFQEFSPGAHHLLLPTFSWYGIATLNYDEIVEKAYERARCPISTIISNSDGSRLEAAAIESSATILLKLHGCITKSEDVALPLILTPSQYADHRANRESLFNTLEQWAADHILIFWPL